MNSVRGVGRFDPAVIIMDDQLPRCPLSFFLDGGILPSIGWERLDAQRAVQIVRPFATQETHLKRVTGIIHMDLTDTKESLQTSSAARAAKEPWIWCLVRDFLTRLPAIVKL